MGDISKHFNRSEFACKCGECGRDCVDAELLLVLEDLRNFLGDNYFCRITSANRCFDHNIGIGGSVKSQHLYGKAADVMIFRNGSPKTQVNPNQVAQYLDDQYQNKYGIGRYDDFTHIDVRSQKARWDNRKK